MKKHHQIIPAVYLLIQRDEKILLLRRFNTGYYDGFYSLVAGHLAGDEPMTAATVREAKEEVGIEIEPTKLNLIHVMHTRSELPGGALVDERVDFYFSVTDFIGNPSNMEQDKCDELQWASLTSLPENIVPRVKKALTAIQDGVLLSTLGW